MNHLNSMVAPASCRCCAQAESLCHHCKTAYVGWAPPTKIMAGSARPTFLLLSRIAGAVREPPLRFPAQARRLCHQFPFYRGWGGGFEGRAGEFFVRASSGPPPQNTFTHYIRPTRAGYFGFQVEPGSQAGSLRGTADGSAWEATSSRAWPATSVSA